MSVEKNRRLGEWLRAERDARNLTLSEVAAGTGPMDQSSLGKIERGEKIPTSAQVEKLAAFFALPLEKLESLRIEEVIRKKYADSPAGQSAIRRIAEEAPAYGRTRK